MASTYELIIKAVDQTSAPMGKIEKALKSTNTRTTRLNATLKKTNNGLKTFGKAGVKGLGSLTKGLGIAAAAATAAAGAFAYMTKSTINTLDTLGKTASKLGVTTEFLSKYQVIANRAGISTETFNMGLQRFLRRLGEAQQGTGELLKPLQQMGINMKDANGNFREGTDVFAEYMTKLAGTESSTQRLALAMKGFDSEGVAMVNIAEMGADKIALIGRRAEEAGLVISGKLTKAAADANDALSDLFDFGKGFKMQFFGALSETIEELSEMLREKLLLKIEAEGGMSAFAKKLAAAFLDGASKFITATASFLDDLVKAFNTFTDGLKTFIVALSNAPIIGEGWSASFDDEATIKAGLELDLAQAKEDLAAVGDWPMWKKILEGGTKYGLAVAQLEDKIKDLEQALTDVDDTIFFEKSTAAAETFLQKSEKYTKVIDEQRDKLLDSAAADELRNQYKVYDDAILRHIRIKKLEGQTNNETNETVKAAILPLNQFDKFMRDLTNSAGAAATKLMHEQQAVAELDRLLAAGRINIDTYAQAMVMLGKGASQAKEEISKMAPHVSQFDQYMRDLVDSSNAAVREQGFEIMALKELDILLQQNKISLDAYAAAKESIRPYDFTKDAPPTPAQMFDEGLTPQQNLDLLTQQIQKEAELLQMKKDMLALAGPENEEAIRKRLGLEEELGFQDRLVETYQKNHDALEDVQEALGNISQLARDAGVSEEFLTEKLKAQEEQLLKQLDLYKEKALTTSEIIEQGFEGMSNSIGSELASAIMKGENMFDALGNAFKRTLDNILQQILTSQINSLLAQMFNIGPQAGMGGGGGGLGSLITGLLGTPTVGAPMGGLLPSIFARAAGGPVSSSRSYLVGERGPELFNPTSSGSITSTDEVNSGNGTVVFNLNSVDTQTGVEFLLKNKPQIINMVSQGFNQRGRQGITS